MRRRARGRGAQRGGRGASRTVAIPAESPKMMSFVQISQRPPSYIRDNRGRGKDRSGRSSNGGILGNLVKAFAMSVAGADTIDGNGNAISGNYYLHKKFKKMTETTSATDDEVDGSEVHVRTNGVLSDNHPISTSSKIVSPPPLTLDLKRTSQDMPNTLINNFTESVDKPNNHQKTNGIHNSVSTIKSTSVYKPKFRLAGNGEIEDVSASKPNSTPPPPFVITTVGNPPTSSPTAQPITDRLLDRQSLDQMVQDRISKIIDQNQSVLLSTWPEHLSKRLKSQTQGHGFGRQYSGSQPPTPSPTLRGSAGSMLGPLVMMSGGSTTEITPTINSARTFVFDGRSPLPSPAMDLGASPVPLSRKKFSFDNTSMSPYSKHNFTDTVNAQTENVSGVADLSDSSSTTSSSQLPKKRQRLSQPSTIFSGGEVSEMPATKKANPLPSTTKNFQDVDLTVRVSNCGPSPSGAKVTIRTNGACPNVLQAAQVQAMELSHLMERNCANTSSGSSSNSHSNQSQVSAAMEQRNARLIPVEQNRDFFPLDLNMKTAKPRGRPPRKRKLGNESDSSTTPAQPTTAASPLDLKTKKICNDFERTEGLSRSGPPSSVRHNGILGFAMPSEDTNKPDIQQLALPQTQVAEDLSTEKESIPGTSGTIPKRPTFLALKPNNPLPKALGDPGVLPSPETPRGAKAYNQMYINGHAYTYLGFKISTRSSYTCLFKPQPMFIPQDTDPKLSMYSNWQARPRDPKTDDVSISTNDSSVNGRKSPLSTWTLAKGKRAETVTVNSPDGQPPLLFTPTTSDLTIANMSPNPSAFSSVSDQAQASSSNPVSFIPFSPTSNFVVKKNLDSHIRKKLSCPSPIDNGNSSSSSGQSINMANFPRTIAKSSHAYGSEDSSDSSSADESNYSMSKLEYERRRRRDDSVCTDGEGQLLRIHSGSNDAKDAALPSSSRSSPDLGRYDNPRVKIMEGGFESNEDYTYIRGRGRGRYVCEACGIRCKKPSMLRKHLKTHTDLRPYTCKLCNFSFKTKGNLTKHQKSKSHHKKCIGLGIHPNSSRSLEMTGPIFDSNDEDDSDDDDNDMDNGCDSDSNQSNDDDRDGSPASCGTNADHLEKEIAQSLLDLSHLSRFPRNGNNCDNKRASPEFTHKRASSVSEEFHTAANHEESTPLNLKANSKVIPDKVSPRQSTSIDAEAPIDLSVRCRKETNAFPRRTNGTVKAMGIVGEAQRWEPEEAFLLNGILNLKKVRNTVIHTEDSSEEITKTPELVCKTSEPEVKIENIEHVPVLGSIHTEEETNGFEYEIKKGCRPGSADPMEPLVVNTSIQGASSASPKLINSPAPNNGNLVVFAGSQRARLHQPWLSPQGSADESFPDSIATRRERTESMNSCLTIESSNSESTVCRDEIEYVPSPPETTPSQSVLPEKPSGPASPNSLSKHFAGFISVKPQAEFRQPSGAQAFIKDEGKAECNICGKTFTRASQLTLHMNIHFLERPFRCDPCGVSFRTKGHLIKHRRSSSHDCKVYLTEAWGVANEENPRPFKCPDCKIAFRIHGHLAKHLRSKMHIMRMECLGKLPFGIYFEMEKSGLNLNEIDTTDCDMSLVSLQNVAKKIYGDTWMERLTLPIEDPA